MKQSVAAGLFAVMFAGSVLGQQPPQPGPEHESFRKFVGDWTLVLSSGGSESKATASYKLALGGLWLTSTLDGEVGGRKYTAQRLDGYDPAKKKYVSVWIDSNLTSPVVTEGTYDESTKTLTQTGDGPGFDGKPTKHKWVSVMKDDDTFDLTVFFGDAKEPALSVAYRRKK